MISVIMPVFNGEKYLNEAIDSILAQSYRNFEFIILNDGSADKTEEIILSYSDPRIVYIKNQQNLGIVDTLNKGIELAKGKYIARMDADDISLPNRFEHQLEFLENNREVGLVGSYFKTIEQNPRVITKPTSHEKIGSSLMFHCTFGHPTIMYRRSIIAEHNICYPTIDHVEDYGFYIKLLSVTKMANLSESLLLYRIHEQQICKQYETIQIESANVIKEMYICWLLNRKLTQAEYKIHQRLLRPMALVAKDFISATVWVNIIYDALTMKNFTKEMLCSQYISIFIQSYRKYGLSILLSFLKSECQLSFKFFVCKLLLKSKLSKVFYKFYSKVI